MSVNMRKSADTQNRSRSQIEQSTSVFESTSNYSKPEIYSPKSDAKQPKVTFQQKIINFFRKHFKKNKYIKFKSKKNGSVNRKKQKPLSQPRSLENIGSNCYLNAALQGISSCNRFCEEISDLITIYNDEIVNLRIFHDLLFHLNGGTFMRMEISKNEIFQNWNKSSQQDSFELLNYCLNEVYNEIREYEENRNRIEVNNYQQWLQIQLPMKIILNYTIRCECGSIEYSPAQSDLAFHLVINNNKHNTIQNAFENFFQDELIDGYICNNMSCINNKSYKCVKLQEPIPKTICIHLQKSHFNGKRMCKIKDKIHFEKSLIVKRNFSSANENKKKLSEIENNETVKKNSFISDNTEIIDLMENQREKSDQIETCIKKVKDKSNKVTNNTDNDINNDKNNINNNCNKRTKDNKSQNLTIRDLRSRNSLFILSVINEALFSSDSMNFKLRESDVNNFFRSSVYSNESEENNNEDHVQMKQKTRSSESVEIECEKRIGIYHSGNSNNFIIENKTNQNNEIISFDNNLNENNLTSNPQNKNECLNNLFEEVKGETSPNNVSMTSENILNENDLTSISPNKNETEIDNNLYSQVSNLRDSDVNNFFQPSFCSNDYEENNTEDHVEMRKEARSSESVEIEYEKRIGICHSGDYNNFIIENKTNQNNEIISFDNKVNEKTLTCNPQNKDETENENCSYYNVVEERTDENTQNNSSSSSETSLIKNDSSSNSQNKNEMQNEICSNNNVVEEERDSNTQYNEIVSFDKVVKENDLTSICQNKNDIQNEICSNNNVTENQTNQNSQNSVYNSSDTLVNEIQEEETFSLKSIIVHLGSVNSGHYVCYKYFNNAWFLADDTRIRKVTEEEILNSDAYILFYEKN